MTYDEFANRFLAALYWESEHNNQTFVRAGYILEKYGLTPKSNWLSRMTDDWEHIYFRDVSKTLGGYDGWSFRISAEGYKKVEVDFADENEILEYLGIQQEAKIAEANQAVDQSIEIDSYDWTGIAAKIDATRLKVVKEQVNALLASIDQSDCDERTKKNARKHGEAVISLLEAPDPPWKLIVEILNSPLLTAFLNTAAVIALIFGS